MKQPEGVKRTVYGLFLLLIQLFFSQAVREVTMIHPSVVKYFELHLGLLHCYVACFLNYIYV